MTTPGDPPRNLTARVPWIGVALACAGLSGCPWDPPRLDLRADTGLPPGPDDTAADVSLRVSTSALDFGSVSVGDEYQKSLTIHNVGDQPRSLLSLEVVEPDAPFAVAALDTLLIPARADLSIGLVFEPVASGPANASLWIETDDPEQPSLSVDLSGEGMAPVLQVEPTSVDLGPVWCGCDISQRIVAYNAGNEGMLVDRVEFDGDGGDLTFALAEESNGPLPWSLSAGHTLDLGTVRYTPADEQTDGAYLTVASSDDRVQELRVPVAGTAQAWAEGLDVFTVPTAQIDVVLAVDRSTSVDPYLPALLAHLPELTLALADLGVDLQVAAVVDDDGCVNGETPWISEDASASQAGAILEAMVTPDGGTTNQERAFLLLEAALDPAAVGAGGCNEGLLRADSALHLVGVSDEAEQSGGAWSEHLAALQASRPDPALVVLHAISGTDDGSCGQPYDGFAAAVEATGGGQVSLCTADWEEDLTALAATMLATPGEPAVAGPYPLSAEPVAASIEVFVDGVRVTSGWWLRDGALLFDGHAVPAPGALLEVGYLALPPDCADSPGR